jgi:hypothetical protein
MHIRPHGKGRSASTKNAADDRDVAASALVRRFEIHGGLLLLNERSNSLFAYNATARHLWDLIVAGCSEEDLASEFAQAWGISLSRARADTRSILTQWRLQGLLAGREQQHGPSGEDCFADWPLGLQPRWASEFTCTIGGVAIAFAIESEKASAIRILLMHLETPDARPQARVELRETAVVKDGVERIRTRDPALLMGGFWQTILELLHPELSWLAFIHGAALARDGEGIALVGASGSGKTTLTAALVSNGFNYYADDLVAIAAPCGAVVPWPMPLSIKPGSLEVLSSHCPGLARAPSYRTKDMDARLLVPDPSAWALPPVTLRSLVFPRFTDGAVPRLERISSFQAIERLLTDRVWIGNPITADRVGAWLAWLGDTPTYVCSYGTLEDGMRLIEDLAR